MSGPDDTSTLTIKLGGGHEAPWLVIYGNPGSIRRQVLETFGIEDDPEISLIELAAKQSVEAQAVYNLATGGAKPVSGGRRASYSKPAKASPDTSGSQADTADEPSEAERNVARIIKEIEAADTLVALKKAWATNQAEFSDKRLQVAFTTKQKALSS